MVFLFFIENKSVLPTHTKQVSVYFLDVVPKHMRRWIGGVIDLSPATWNAHILLEGKNVVCDISYSLYSMLKKTSNNERFGLLRYHHALFSDEIVCERLDAIVN